MLVLDNPVRPYAWGSSHRLARFLDREPSGSPEAELWIGAHQADPSRLADGRRLDEAIAADPVGMLGERVAADFGGRLPFLMKVLAVDQPLSLQVHPSAERARLGFLREDRAGVPHDAPGRSYTDPWHKPELLYALTRFEGMAGFRDVGLSAELLTMLAHPWADRLAADLVAGQPAQTLRSVVPRILALAPEVVRGVLAELVEAARRAAATGHRDELAASQARRARPEPRTLRREAVRVFELFPSLAQRYPDDPGVLVTLLLNHLVLAPGEAMYVDAGVVHAYASGVGVEVMAASDNVLRAGLTPKHRDVPELLAATDFTPMPAPRWDPHLEGTQRHFSPPVADFALTVAHPEAPGRPPTALPGPAVLLCLEGPTTLTSSDGASVVLERGGSVFVPAAPGGTTWSGGLVAVGHVPR